MKTDLATTILAGAIGFIAAFLICNLLLTELRPISSVEFKELSGEINYEVIEPDANVFNYRALNPTVEVYIGEKDANISDDNLPEDTTDIPNIEE